MSDQTEKRGAGEATPAPDLIIGRNAVSEALRAGRAIDRIQVAKGQRTGSILPLIAKARDRGIPVKESDMRKLDAIAGPHHQGIIAFAACREYASLDDLFKRADSRAEPPFFVVCDEIEDPHNLGAIIRTAECAGAHGVIVPKRRNAGLSLTVEKASAGAVEHLPIARVTNITDTLRELKKRNVWVYGLDMDGVSWEKTDLSGAVAVVVGSEGRGLSRLVREACDGIVSLPLYGNIQSLNASVACGIVLYEIARRRHTENSGNGRAFE